MLPLIRGTAEREDLLAGLALVPGGAEPGHAVFGALALADVLLASPIEGEATWGHGLQVVTDEQEFFSDGQIAVHREAFAAQKAFERRLGLPGGNPEVSTGQALAVIDLNSSGCTGVPRPFELGIVRRRFFLQEKCPPI